VSLTTLPLAVTPSRTWHFLRFLVSLIARDNRLASQSEFNQASCPGCASDPLTGFPFGFYPVFLRGDAQTNTVVRLNQSLFAKFSDIRSSMGAEVRFQIPILNVPFRLIMLIIPTRVATR